MLNKFHLILRHQTIRTQLCLLSAVDQMPVMSSVSIGGQRQTRFKSTKDYDKVVKLDPIRVEYNYKDSKFFNEHRLDDQAFPRLTDDEICDLTSVKLEKDYPDRHGPQIDINAQPYRQVLADGGDDPAMEGSPNKTTFTETEVISDKNVWFWVQRLLPNKDRPRCEATDDPVVTTTGFRPPPKTKPDVDYFIARTRTQLYPVYRKYCIEGRNHEEYWKNRWDGLFNRYHLDLLDRLDKVKFENNERTVTHTIVQQIEGNIWHFEEDLREELERRHRKRILSAINEVKGILTLKGDFVDECVQWLIDKGF